MSRTLMIDRITGVGGLLPAIPLPAFTLGQQGVGMASREFKDRIYAEFARVGHALASPKRIELLGLLSQGEKTVEVLADQTATPIKNTSAHLRVLRQAGLVETRRSGTYIHYRLAGPEIALLLRHFEAVGHRHLAEVERATRTYLDRRDEMRPVELGELRRLMRDGEVVVIDVRPADEYLAGHIPGALSIPVPELRKRLRTVPRHKEVIAYC